MLLITGTLLTGCGKESLYENNTSGYTQQTCIESAIFDMPETMLSQATAITAISEDSDYSQNAFVYKNGHDTYLMFDISSVVVIVKEGTNYDFENSKNEAETLQSDGINGIWFSQDGKKLECETEKSDNKYKTMITADADVSITSDVYGMFAGKFANVKEGDTEISMFIGAKADSYEDLTDSQVEIIEHIAKSLDIIKTEEDTEEAVSLDESTEKKAESSTEDVTEENTENPEESTVAEDDVVVIEDGQTSLPEENKEAETQEEPETVLGQPAETAASEPADARNYVSLESNQIERASDSMYSSIYSMLEIGETGVLQSLSYNTAEYEENYMTINAVYTGEDAINIIKGYCESGNAAYEYQDAPAGCSWNVIEYTLAKSQSNVYTNICLEGLDGEKLKYRGVSYDKRTHDIFSYETQTENGYEKLYCYYAVPNGCKEYMIEAGDPGVESLDAFFHIKIN